MAHNAKRPSVYVSQNGGRKKIHSEKYIYLIDKSEFDIELINPTKETLLAKIELNGNLISNSGLVLRPGERILLKRFIDENKAFIFNSYEVSSDSVTKEAIADNGKIKVYFYKETVIQPTLCYPFIWNSQPSTYITYPYYQQYNQPNSQLYNQQYIWCGSSVTGSNNLNSLNINTTINTTAFNSDNTVIGSANGSTDGIFTTNCSTINNLNSTSVNFNSELGTIETGRIEKGKNTNQTFDNIEMSFDSFCSYITELLILPDSRKPIEKEELKVYCHKCGIKAKFDDNFCSKCGTKLNK